MKGRVPSTGDLGGANTSGRPAPGATAAAVFLGQDPATLSGFWLALAL